MTGRIDADCMGGVRLRPVVGGRQTRIRLNIDAEKGGMQPAHHTSHGGVYLDASLTMKGGATAPTCFRLG